MTEDTIVINPRDTKSGSGREADRDLESARLKARGIVGKNGKRSIDIDQAANTASGILTIGSIGEEAGVARDSLVRR